MPRNVLRRKSQIRSESAACRITSYHYRLGLICVASWFTEHVPNFLNQSTVGALIAGIIGSAVSTFTVITWANRATS
jgi:hypothetical protein